MKHRLIISPVAVQYCAKPVSHHQDSAFGACVDESLLDDRGSLGVHGGRRLVQYHDLCWTQQQAGQAQELLLTSTAVKITLDNTRSG